MVPHPVSPLVPAPRSPECHIISQAPIEGVKQRFITNATVTACEFLSITPAHLNPLPPLPSVTFGLIPLARRVGLSAVAAAYDRGLQVAVLRS